MFLSEDWEVPPRGFTRRALILALARHLAKLGGTILCVDRPVCPVVTAVKNPRKLFRWASHRSGLRRIAPGLFVFTPWMFLHERLAPRLPGVVALNQKVLRNQITDCLSNTLSEPSRVVVWVFHPYQKDMLGVLNASDLIVYECHDEYMASGYVTADAAHTMRRYAEAILQRADVVITTARALYESHRTRNHNTYLIPNGVDVDLFLAEADLPADISSITFPRIGYAGAVNQNLDFDLLDELASSDTGWNFVFVGPFSWNGLVPRPASLDRLRERGNVFFLGTKPYYEMPAYLRGLDVLIIPYVKNEATWAAYPLKLNEYLAVGRPVVSTSFSPDMLDFASVVTLAETAQEFSRGIEKAIANPNAQRLDLGRKLAASNSWDKRAEQICGIINGHLSRQVRCKSPIAGE